MADDGVLQEFLVSVGFKLDEGAKARLKAALVDVADIIGKVDQTDDKRTRNQLDQQKRRRDAHDRETKDFQDQLKKQVRVATTQGLLIAEALAGVAEAAAKSVSSTISQFDKLYFTARNTGASIEGLERLRYQFKQIGMTAQDADGMVSSIARSIRTTPGAKNWIARNLGLDPNQTPDELARQTAEALVKKFRIYGTAALAGSQVLGIPEEYLNSLLKNKDAFNKAGEDFDRKQRQLGLNFKETTEDLHKLMNVWREIELTITDVFAKIGGELGKSGLTKGLQDLDAWLMGHSGEVAAGIKTVAEAAGGAAKFFAEAAVALKPVWEGFDKLARSTTGQSGLQVVFELMGVALLTRVIPGLRGAVGLTKTLFTLFALAAPKWLLPLLALGTAAYDLYEHPPGSPGAEKYKTKRGGVPFVDGSSDPAYDDPYGADNTSDSMWQALRRAAKKARQQGGATYQQQSFTGSGGGLLHRAAYYGGGAAASAASALRTLVVELGQETRNWVQGLLAQYFGPQPFGQGGGLQQAMYSGGGAAAGGGAGAGGSAAGGRQGGHGSGSKTGGDGDGGGDGTPFAPGRGIDRERFRKELEKNPALRDKIMRIAANEQGANAKGTQMILESMMNRAQVRGTTLEKQARWHRSEGGYYDEGNMGRGALENKRHRQVLEKALEGALNNSNLSNYATDNSSGSLAARERATGKFRYRSNQNGETFFAPGWAEKGLAKRWDKWFDEAQKAPLPPVANTPLPRPRPTASSPWLDVMFNSGRMDQSRTAFAVPPPMPPAASSVINNNQRINVETNADFGHVSDPHKQLDALDGLMRRQSNDMLRNLQSAI